MVKKIKVVEMNTSNPEAPDGVQESAPDPMPMQENIPQPITQVQEPVITKEEEPVAIPQAEPKKPRQPRQPKAPFVEGSVPTPRKEGGKPKPPKEQKLVRQPIAKAKAQDPPPSESDSIDTEEMVEVIKNHRAKKKQPTQAQEPPIAQTKSPEAPPQAKEEEKVNCPDCGKIMSAKSLKYAHAKNCRVKLPTNQQQPRADFMLNAIEADKRDK